MCLFIWLLLQLLLLLLLLQRTAAGCAWRRWLPLVVVVVVGWLVGWLVGCLVVFVEVCLVGWLIYALTRIQKAKIYIKMEFHFISAHTERERERVRGKTCLATLALQQQQE